MSGDGGTCGFRHLVNARFFFNEDVQPIIHELVLPGPCVKVRLAAQAKLFPQPAKGGKLGCPVNSDPSTVRIGEENRPDDSP